MYELGEHRLGYEEKFKSEYQRMSEKERNAELFRLHEFLPDFLFEVSTELSAEDINTAYDQREESETTQLLCERLAILLSYSYITESYGQELNARFKELCIYGLYRPKELDYLSEVNGWDIPNTGGIFSPKTASLIEEKAYQDAVSQHIIDKAQHVNDYYNTASSSNIGKSELVDVVHLGTPALDNLQDLASRQQFLATWRHDFSQRFSRKPMMSDAF